MNKILFPLLAVMIMASDVLSAQDRVTPLETGVTVEARLLERALTQYQEFRALEREAHRRLEDHRRKLDEALRNEAVSVGELRQLESALVALREEAHARARELAEQRARLYNLMERLAELQTEAERQRQLALARKHRFEGTWEIDFGLEGESGEMKLRVDGALVSGFYRLENGAHGSVRGNLAGDTVRLERVDSEFGYDLTFEGAFTPATMELGGDWTAMDLTGGKPSGGKWTARKR
jgi:hypothetical protein